MAEVNHSERSHSTWSASATARNLNCPGSLALSQSLNRPETESEAAGWGTACHEIAEKCLCDGVDADIFIGDVIKAKGRGFEVDDEMAETAMMYVDYCRKRIADYEAEHGFVKTWWIEEHFSLEAIQPPFDAGGTADFVIYFPMWRLLEVVDLKGGRGVVVEAKNNGQARSYSLGAILKHTSLKVDKVMSTIVQPRAGHPDGRIRSEVLPVADLLTWTAELKKGMLRSKAAMVALAAAKEPGQRHDWNKEYLKAGNHCQFCPAAGTCPTLEQKSLDFVGLWFDDMSAPRLANAPSEHSNERLAQILDAADMIKEFLKAIASEATYRVEQGQEVPNYVLVQKMGRRSWIEREDLTAAIYKATGMRGDEIHNMKLKSPAQIEKALGKKRIGEIADLWHTPKRGVDIARVDKTTRPKAQSLVDEFFGKPD